MPFRVGLLFYSSPVRPFALGLVAKLLEKINKKTMPARGEQTLTLVTFVRTRDMALFADALSTSDCAIEAAGFDKAGVTFGPLDVSGRTSHPEHDEVLDFNLGMNVLLTCCEVILVVCKDESEKTEIRNRLELHHNTSLLLALLPVQHGQPDFLEINPLLTNNDETGWLLALKECWEAKDLTPYPPPVRKRTVLGLLFPLFYKTIMGRWSETLKRRHKLKRSRSELGLSETANKKLEPLDRESLDAVRAVLGPYFSSHDSLALHYSNIFRTTCFLVPLLIVISTVLAVAAVISHSLHNVLHVVEGILLLVAATLYFRSNLAKHHRKWVANRLIAEFLRLALLNQLFHTLPRLTLPAEEPELWVDSCRLLLKHLRSLPIVVFITPRVDLLSARISAIADFVSYQSEWHKDFAAQHRAAGRRLTRISTVAFVVTLCLCFVQLFLSYYLPKEIGPEKAEIIPQVLMMLTLISASCAFVLSLLSHQLGFEAIAERSENAAEHFDALVELIKESGHVADARQLYSWANECAGTILAEQHSWYRHIPAIQMHL